MKLIRPKVTCGAIIEKNDKILLILRNNQPYKNYWCLPGGHVEWGEKAEQAIKREVKEETGLDFQPKFFKYQDEIIPQIKWHAVVIFFTENTKPTAYTEGKIKRSKEVKKFKWFSEKEIKKIKLAFLNKQILKDYFQAKEKKT